MPHVGRHHNRSDSERRTPHQFKGPSKRRDRRVAPEPLQRACHQPGAARVPLHRPVRRPGFGRGTPHVSFAGRRAPVTRRLLDSHGLSGRHSLIMTRTSRFQALSLRHTTHCEELLFPGAPGSPCFRRPRRVSCETPCRNRPHRVATSTISCQGSAFNIILMNA